MRYVIEADGHHLDLLSRTHIMGILNITPDSFSDGGLYLDTEKAVEHALRLADDGADIIDIGGESTRPYSQRVPLEEELKRVIPVIEGIRRYSDIPISIDTYKAEVAKRAIDAGASIVNDITALRGDPLMAEVVRDRQVPLVLMHMKGDPSNMQDNPTYDNLMQEISLFLKERAQYAISRGISEEKVIVDPGIGFGKTFEHNLEIINRLGILQELGYPILIGTSRKRFLGEILNKEPMERDIGTMATVTAAILNGANIVRVHNVKMAKDVVKVADALKKSLSK
ncbi:MAG TPA: dihydropteroate synthase [Desulfobacteraceae bacterium]|nr:dihydropteroate synthase [Desulfobacteraceae bacterium]